MHQVSLPLPIIYSLCDTDLFNPYIGNVYIVDWRNNRVRKVTVSTGIITTFAGTGTTSFAGDNGPAISATVNNPVGGALDTSGTYSLILLVLISYLSFN